MQKAHEEEPCGIRLMRLIETQIFEIAKREFKNETKMCLYGTGEFWTAFEHSAYLLKRAFPDLKPFVINHPSYPSTIIGLSVPTEDLNTYIKQHIIHSQKRDYIEFTVAPFNPKEYGEWHAKEVSEFMEKIDGYVCKEN